jgi:hypothetical protein
VHIDERLMKKKHALLLAILLPFIILLISCGGPTVEQAVPQQTVTVNPKFQSQLSPIPTLPTYRCGAWASNNTPGPNDTITIYARLTQNLAPVNGAMASAVVHFQGNDQALDQHPTSDTGGYVSFTVSLQGQQPVKIPATVEVTFTNFPGGTLRCSQAFFTPQ